MSRPGYGVEVLGAIEEREPLFNDPHRQIVVTPSWLNVEQTRYAIRTVVRLDNQTTKPSVGAAYFFFFIAIALMAYSVYQFTKPQLPIFIPWIMLLGSLVICLGSAWLALSAKTRYRIQVTLIDGYKVGIQVDSGDTANKLLSALTLAMDWHRSADIVIDAERASHVRRRLATAAHVVTGYAANNDVSASEAGHKDSAESKRRRAQRLAPILASMFKGRQQ